MSFIELESLSQDDRAELTHLGNELPTIVDGITQLLKRRGFDKLHLADLALTFKEDISLSSCMSMKIDSVGVGLTEHHLFLTSKGDLVNNG